MDGKESTVRVPVRVERQAWRSPDDRWSAAFVNPDPLQVETRWSASGRTASEAKANLTAVVVAGMARYDAQTVMIIGGAGEYTRHIHVVKPDQHGYTVYVLRDGCRVCTWMGDEKTVDEAVRRVLDHVGGEPKVVRL